MSQKNYGFREPSQATLPLKNICATHCGLCEVGSHESPGVAETKVSLQSHLGTNISLHAVLFQSRLCLNHLLVRVIQC
jgi:hypothetical protein